MPQSDRDGKIVRLAITTLYLYGQDDKHNQMARLDSFIDAIAGKRLTYARLIAKVPA